MRYFGGKQRISKELAYFINERLDTEQPFVDLFCGSCNVVSNIDNNRIRFANDLHKELIEMWRYVQCGGELPDSISEDEYHIIKKHGEPWLKAFVGFGCSYSGKYWGGYARGGENRNYCLNAKNSTIRKMKTMGSVVFSNNNYDEFEIPDGALVYCDIPYKGTTSYSTGEFDHDKFYDWARDKKDSGFDIIVSEYKENLPLGWEIVWEKESKKDIRNKDGVQSETKEVLMTPKEFWNAG